jgi:NSS family neurotransmitter:Na+ symporter
MASIGAAVGLGNFWRFPYQAGENGGGAFVLIYIGVVIFVAIPLVMSELLIGRRGQSSAVGSARALGQAEGGTGLWSIIGWVGMIASFLVLTFYSVIAGWVMAYIPKAIQPGAFSGGADAVGATFTALLGDPTQLIIWHSIFMGITVFIVMQGLHNGIERAATILMPAFFIMLLFAVFYATSSGDYAGTLDFLFNPRWEEVGIGVIMDAIGQAFFSVGVATAILITYGAYLQRDAHLPRSSFVISFADTGVAVLAGLAIFPLVFANQMDPNAGPGLLFVTLPLAFADLPFSQVFGTVFFTLAFFAALTSSIALLEIAVSWAVENRHMKRVGATVAFGGLAWLIGLFQALSFNVMNNTLPDGFLPGVEDRNFFGFIDFITANIMLPLGGILIAVFVGWVVSRETAVEELGISGIGFRFWRLLVRFVIPILVGLVLILNTAQNGFGINLLSGLNGG